MCKNERVESDWFNINSGVRQGCVMSPWLFNLYMDGVMKELGVGVSGDGVRMMENGRAEGALPIICG